MRPDDAFWGARIVAAFSDAAIRAIVGKAAYSDHAATDHMTRAIIARRDIIARTWLNGVNPIADVELSADGRMRFHNAAVDAGAAKPAELYTVAWSASTTLLIRTKRWVRTRPLQTWLPRRRRVC